MPEVSLTASSADSLIVVSNREPYEHTRRADGSIEVAPTTGGVSVALDALMRERGGTWIAAGSGDADAEVVDAHDRVGVPPDAPAYVLRRVWLSADDERRYYDGFSNEGLWPLAHTVHVRPRFRSEDWSAYQRVNKRFAAAVAAELTDEHAPCSSRTIILRWWRRSCAGSSPGSGPRSSGTSRGRTPTASGSARGARKS